MMDFEKGRGCAFICFMIFLLFWWLCRAARKKQKMERHWEKGEIYFSENKLNEAILEYKNVIHLALYFMSIFH